MLEIILVDGHAIMRDGIKAILENFNDFRVVPETASGAEAVRLCRQLRPQVVVTEIDVDGLDGIEATREIRRHCPETNVVVLTMAGDQEAVESAIRSGARAFVLKSGPHQDLIDALWAVSRGGSYLSSAVSDHLAGLLSRSDPDRRPGSQMLTRLTPREIQVLRLAAGGRTNKEIATLLSLSIETVRSYRKTLMSKTGAANVAGLTKLALTCGLMRGGNPESSEGLAGPVRAPNPIPC